MNREQAEAFERSNYSIDGSRLKERRFDLDERPAAATTPMTEAVAAYDRLPDSQKAALQAWIDGNIEPATPRIGGSEFVPAYSGQLWTDTLAQLAGYQLREMNGALLAHDPPYLPTRASALRNVWRIGAKFKA